MLEEIGRGAMGVVYRAYDPQLDRKVALKLVLDDADAGQRVQQEARALARTSHPNVLTIHDVGIDEGRAFIAMELVDGSSLAQWNETRHAWREVVPIFIAAGQGLAAAHAAGLVHRDFKPSNVMLTRDGRVLVTDFGLARPLDETRSFVTPAGTPAYMGPEQFIAGPVDGRADQFAFCVALFESLWGVRPYDAPTVPEASLRASLGVTKPPRHPRTPRWLRRLVIRGLSPTPSQRFATMEELLAALRDGQRRSSRSRIAVVAAASGVALVAGVLLFRGEDRCEIFATMKGTWDVERAAAIEHAFVASGVPYAIEAAEAARGGLDAHAAGLSTRLRDTCTAADLDAAEHRKLACLAEERERLRTLVDLLVEADADVVERSFAVVGRLKGGRECDVVGRAAEDPADQIPEAERDELRRMAALHELGKFAAARDAADTLAAATSSPIVHARALFVRGGAEERLGEMPASEQSLFDAYAEAHANADADYAIRSAAWLTVVVGADLGRVDEGLQWGHIARALAERTGQLDRFARGLEGDLAQVYQRRGDLDAALQHAKLAVELAEVEDPRNDVAFGISLMNVGSIHGIRKEIPEARAYLERAVAILRDALPPAHSDLAVAQSNLAQAMSFQGERAAAAEVYVGLLASQREAYGPDHIDVARIEYAYGSTLESLGRRAEARALFEHALVVFERVQGETHVMVASTLMQLGLIELALGDGAAAVRMLERAAAIMEHHPEDRETAGRVQYALAHALAAAGGETQKRREATERARRAFAADPLLASDLADLEAWSRSLGE